jgi:hypothetical protein
MRVAGLLLLVLGGTAYAQPGAAPPPPVQQPYPQPQPQQYPPPPYQYQPGYGVPISREEHELLLQGEISDGAHIGGGVASLFFGFGVGQAVQGRWSDKGYIFTIGEVGTFALMIAGVVRTFDDCAHDLNDGDDDCGHSDGPPLIIVGALGFSVFRIWEIVDAFSGPSDHNRRVRELKFRLGIPVQVGARVKPFVNKTRDGGATAGLTFRF